MGCTDTSSDVLSMAVGSLLPDHTYLLSACNDHSARMCKDLFSTHEMFVDPYGYKGVAL